MEWEVLAKHLGSMLKVQWLSPENAGVAAFPIEHYFYFYLKELLTNFGHSDLGILQKFSQE